MKSLRSLILTALVLAALPSAALASPTQESMFQDDPMLVYGTDQQVTSTLTTLRAFGVDRLRISVFWRIIAPANDRVQRPSFDASDPGAYPPELWAPYDRIVRLAANHGIALNFNLTSPIPRWAATESPRTDLQETFGPNAEEFGKFVRAIGTRYSGGYQDLPRVSYWSIWNEPNQAGWLTPQWSPDPRDNTGKAMIEAAPTTYRKLVAAAWTNLADTGHGADTILVGETAPQGQQANQGLSQSLDPLRFLRRLYCLDDNANILKGDVATATGCPTDAATFVAQNPALFHATGYAHHPYALLTPPGRKSRSPDWVSMADLRKLTRELTRIYRRYGQKLPSRRGVPLYLTEYGYQTKPDPFSVSFARQAAWINEAEYVAFKNPLVRSMSQFLLVDDAPVAGVDPKKDPQLYWRTFQSGLKSLTGKRKPSYTAYITPIHLKSRLVRRGRGVGVFGLLRGAKAGTNPSVQIQFRPKGAKRWHTRRTVKATGPRHFLNSRVRIIRAGHVRLRWRNGGGRAIVSRAAPISIKR